MKPKIRQNKDGAVWYCEWWEGPQRVHRSQNIGPADGPGALSRKQASRLLSEFAEKLEKQLQQRAQALSAFTTVEQAAEMWLAANDRFWSANTRQAFRCQVRRVVIPALGRMLVSEVRSSHVEALLADQAGRGLSQSSVSQTKSVVCGMFAWIAANVQEVRPFPSVRLPRDLQQPRATEILTPDLIEHVITREGWTGTALRLMLFCGLRVGEAMAVRPCDISADGVLTVSRAVKPDGIGATKTRRSRVVPVPPVLLAEIRAMKRAPEELLFHKENGGHYWPNELGRLVPFQTRRLRTTFATLVSRDTAGVQAMLGHTTPRTTLEYYQQALPAQNRADVDALEQKLRRRAG